VISVLMIAFSVAALWASARILKGRDYSTLQRGGTSLQQRRLTGGQAFAAYAWIGVVLLLVLSPHIGILLMSFSKVWSFSVLPEGFTLAHYATVFTESPRMIGNTLLYCGLAALIDVILGTAIAYIILRTRLPGRQMLDWMASAALAIPGVVLAIGYLRTFRGMELPFFDTAFTSTWVALVVAYAVRRLPYALRSCMAALQQMHVSLEEAAESLGATKARTVRRVVVPLMAGGILAGFVTSFITAAVELSATIVLSSSASTAPMSYGIYLYMQSIAGRGPGAALGVIAVVIVAVGTFASYRLMHRQQAAAPAITPA
jgi:iron(III) transport system permease protein